MGKRDQRYLLGGLIEVDDGYIGTPTKNGKRGRGTAKTGVVVSASTNKKAVYYAKMTIVDHLDVCQLKQIAKDLNIGEDSIVFIDDNPVEQELVRKMTNVCVVNFPKDIYRLSEWFVEEVVEKYFAKISLTKEDIKKQEQYIAKMKRDSISKNLSYDDFLKELNIKFTFFINDNRFIKRYSQMTQKTNQFNLTTKRYTIKDIEFFVNSDKFDVIAVNYEDKFANEGITGLAILNHISDTRLEIDTFLLSCRILKRGVEKALIDKIIKLNPTKDIVGVYIPTDKNMQTKDLYLLHGFEKIDNNKFIKRIVENGK